MFRGAPGRLAARRVVCARRPHIAGHLQPVTIFVQLSGLSEILFLLFSRSGNEPLPRRGPGTRRFHIPKIV